MVSKFDLIWFSIASHAFKLIDVSCSSISIAHSFIACEILQLSWTPKLPCLDALGHVYGKPAAPFCALRIHPMLDVQFDERRLQPDCQILGDGFRQSTQNQMLTTWKYQTAVSYFRAYQQRC